jgi:hypothetical protein
MSTAGLVTRNDCAGEGQQNCSVLTMDQNVLTLLIKEVLVFLI